MKTLRYIRLSLLLALTFVSMILSSCTDDEVNKNPIAEITAPSTNDSYAVGATIIFKCTASDPEDGEITKENIIWNSSIDGSLGNGAELSTTLTEGIHKITLTAIDNNGNEVSDEITLLIIKDSKPSIYITKPSEDISVPQNTEILFKCIANDIEDGELSGNSIEWSSDKDGVLGNGNSITIDNLSINTHVISVKVTDSKGLCGTDEVTVTILNNNPPEVNIIGISENEIFSDLDYIKFECSATDELDGNLDGSSIVWNSNLDGKLGEGLIVNASLTPGNHQIIVTATDSHQNVDKDTVNITITEADKLPVMLERMIGSFSSEKQSQTSSDQYHFDVRREVIQIWDEETDGFWIYLEQAYASDVNNPYFQRVYHFYEIDGKITNTIYKLNNEDNFVGSWATPEDFDAITVSDLIERDNCGLEFIYTDGHFYGTTSGEDCLSTIPGVAYMTSEQWIYADRWDSWDLGYNENDQIVMGPYSPYEFDKL